MNPTRRPYHVSIASGLLVILGSAAGRGEETAPSWGRASSIEYDAPIAAVRVLTLNDGVHEHVLVVEQAGRLRLLGWDHKSGSLVEVQGNDGARLADPAHCLLSLADVRGAGAPQLIVVSRSGTFVHDIAPSGVISPQGERLSRRAKCPLRTGEPMFADFVQDLNGDGRLDLKLPTFEACELWLNELDDDGRIVLHRTATVALDVSELNSHAQRDLSDTLRSGIDIPAMNIRDVNGDGRPDLLVEDDEKHDFYLQTAAGTYGERPDVSLALELFRDTTREASFEPGEVIPGNETASYESRDLNDDGIPDYVIAHRRKVWVFHGGGAGPQFTKPATILKVAEDVTALLVMSLDEDPYPDLLLIKVDAPGISTLIRGLLTQWDVSIRSTGYRNEGGQRFETSPTWKSERALRLPPILDMVKNFDKLMEKFRGVENSFRASVHGDFDGDGALDLWLTSEVGDKLEYWSGASHLPRKAELSDDAGLRRVLFGEQGDVWDLDRLLARLSDMATGQVEQMTDGREPELDIPLRPDDEHVLLGALAADLLGNGREELLLLYETQAQRHGLALDVWRLR